RFAALTLRSSPGAFFSVRLRPPPRSPLFPYTTLFRSLKHGPRLPRRGGPRPVGGRPRRPGPGGARRDGGALHRPHGPGAGGRHPGRDPGRRPDHRGVDGAGGARHPGPVAQRDPRPPAPERRGAAAGRRGGAAARRRAFGRPARAAGIGTAGRRGTVGNHGPGRPVPGPPRRRAAGGPAAAGGGGRAGPVTGAARWSEELRSMVGGSVKVNEPLRDHTTLQIGGPVDVMVFPARPDDLVRVVRWCLDRRVPYSFLGFGSNVLAPDEGLEGVLLRTKPALDFIRFEGTRVVVGTGASVARLVAQAAA